jgi:hypothetical protein
MLTMAYKKQNGYEFSAARFVFTTNLPAGKYDYVVNLSDHGSEKFQDQIEKQFGLRGHIETRETDVLALKVRNPAAPGLHSDAQLSLVGQGFLDVNSLAKYLEGCFKKPVVDETKLPDTQPHCFIVPFDEVTDTNSLKKTLFDAYGLELVPTNMPIEMLVVEKVK